MAEDAQRLAEQATKQAKKDRTIAKGQLTRAEKSVFSFIGRNRASNEVEPYAKDYFVAYEKVKRKHDDYLQHLDLDDEYIVETEQEWIDAVVDHFDANIIEINNYYKTKLDETNNADDTRNTTLNASSRKKKNLKVKSQKVDKPTFSGKYLDFYDFLDDFEFIYGDEEDYTEDEALYCLKTCIPENAKPWLLNMKTYSEAKDELVEMYGDPKKVSDAFINEILKFKIISTTDQYEKLYHLINRAKKILARDEVRKSADLDNSTTLSQIESKLSSHDREMWARYQLEHKINSSLDTLLDFMKFEISVKRRAGDDIRQTSISAPSKSGKTMAASGSVTTVDYSQQQPVSPSPVVAVIQSAPSSSTSYQPINNPANNNNKPKPCWICSADDAHPPHECPRFVAMTPDQRLNIVKEKHVCWYCLKFHRFSQPCRGKTPCPQNDANGIKCKFSHHTLLHGANFDRNKPVGTGTGIVGVVTDANEGLLPIVLSKIINPQNKTIGKPNSCTFIDGGANLTLIRMKTALELNLPSVPITVSLGKVGGDRDLLHTKLFTLLIQSMLPGKTTYYKIKAVGISEICDKITEIDMNKFSQIFNIEVTNLLRGHGFPDLLIGTDYVKFHSGKTVVNNNIAVRYSILGPIVFGSTNNDDHFRGTTAISIVSKVEPDLSKFIEAEEMGVSLNPCCTKDYGGKKLPLNEKLEEQQIRNSAIKIPESQRWLIPGPYEKDPAELPNNYYQAEGGLYRLEEKLEEQGPEICQVYDNQIMELNTNGCTTKCSENEKKNYKGPTWYLHHGPVFRDSETTPCRPCYDPGRKCKGKCLKDYQMKGPDLLNDQKKIIIRFRDHEVAIDGDASRMYHQILNRPTYDGNLHRFLWRNFDKTRAPDVYKFLVLTFGDKCSPALANIAMNMTAEEFRKEYPEAVDTILNSRYMDDILDSYPSPEIAAQRIEEIDKILVTGHFHIKYWISNCPELPTKNPETKIKANEASEEKVLGLGWNTKEDVLHIVAKIPKMLQHLQDWTRPTLVTKRIVLSIIAEVYDLIGFCGPFIVTAKIELQKLWKAKYSWDVELPPELQQFWYQFLNQLKIIGTATFPRCMTPNDAVGRPLLIVFCDSSVNCFGACAYARWKLTNGQFESRFIIAKNRVAPLKTLTIPQLELNSCVIAARLNDSILSDSRLDFEKSILFTDSRIALAWIKSESRQLKPFVSVRIGEIHMKTKTDSWHHIPSAYNTADDLTRGLKVEELQGRWKTGDPFLALPEEEWPKSEETLNDDEKNTVRSAVLKKAAVSVAAAKIEKEKTDKIEKENEFIRRFSELRKAIRVTAYIERFIKNLKTSYARTLQKKKQKIKFRYEENPSVGIKLTIKEVQHAEKSLVIQAQKSLPLAKNKLASLNPTKNEDGIYVVKSRIDSLVTYTPYNPPLLPKNSWFAFLYVRHVHEKRGHSGVAACSAKVRRKYWIIGVANLAKRIKNDCKFCREFDAKTELQVMSDLPKIRQNLHTPPFYCTAVDLWGPITVKFGRNKTMKCYGVLFTCLMVRAVYLDVATDYSTPGILFVLRRFLAIRGYPHELWSDRGSQLVGASNELKRMVEDWDHEELRKFCHERQMKWSFFTPTAAHHNGCAESLIKTTKRALKATVGSQTLTPLELQTVLFEIMNLINQRPIGRIPNDPSDGAYLSPNDLLLGRASSDIPQGPFFETTNTRHRFEFCQNIVNNWWKRWYRDVFPLLVPRKKWHTSNRNLCVGDFVLIKDPNPIRGHYSRGIITSVFKGNDGTVRNVQVKTNTGLYERPITKIVLICPNDDESEDENDGD